MGIYPVDDADNPMPTSYLNGRAERNGASGSATVTLPRGSYALMLACESAAPCVVHFNLDLTGN